MRTTVLITACALALAPTLAFAQGGAGSPQTPRPAAKSASQPSDPTGMTPNKSGSGTSTSGGSDANGDQGRDAMPDSSKTVKPLHEQNKQKGGQ